MELVREIIVPTTNSYLLKLPDELVGKHVEVIAFEIESGLPVSTEDRMKKINESLSDLKTNLSNWKFNRDEANDYDE